MPFLLLQTGANLRLQGAGSLLLQPPVLLPLPPVMQPGPDATPAGGPPLPFWAAPGGERHAKATAEPVAWSRKPAARPPVPQRAPRPVVHARAVAEPVVVACYYARSARALAEPVIAYPRSVPALAEPCIVDWWTRWHRELAAGIEEEDELLLLGVFDE